MNQSSTSFIILFLTLFSSLSVSNAWTMPRIRRGSNTIRTPMMPKRFRKSSHADNTERYFRNGVEEIEPITTMTPSSLQSSATVPFEDGTMNIMMDTTMPVVVTTTPRPPLRTMDLPKHSPPTSAIQKAKMMWDLELILGRAAMVMGVFMLLGEVCFGVSPLV